MGDLVNVSTLKIVSYRYLFVNIEWYGRHWSSNLSTLFIHKLYIKLSNSELKLSSYLKVMKYECPRANLI